jgi:ABC-type lipoprotein release transport system permease subunit
MLFKIAWRNVWRNKSRSLVVIFAIAIGILGAVFFAAFMTGMVKQQASRSIHIETAHIQLCHPDFIKSEALNTYVSAGDYVNKLSQYPEVKSVSARISINGMATTAGRAMGIRVLGIEPEVEKQTTLMWQQLDTGSYFESDSKAAPILVSRKQASELKLKLGSKVVLNLPDTAGNITYGLFRVTGIYRTGNGIYDGLHMFVKIEDIQALTGLPEDARHEIAVLLHSDLQTPSVLEKIKRDLPALLARDWGELQPAIKMYAGFINQFNTILLSIILIALIFGIINTMLMVILERTREIGMLRAVGMHGRQVAIMIILETVFLSLVGGALGCLLSVVIVGWLNRRGMDLTEYMQMVEDYGWSPIIYPEVEPIFYLQIAVMVSLTAVVASYFPVQRALKLHPATAIREL